MMSSYFSFQQTEHGYILDCIDIQKQLAFDHPLLKNHSIKVLSLKTRINLLTKFLLIFDGLKYICS